MLEERSLEQRVAECKEDDACELSQIEISFGIPVQMTQEEQQQLIDWVSALVERAHNQPVNGVHWLCEIGSKLIYSDIDAAVMRKPPLDDPRKPANGEEPVHDDNCYVLGCAARPFVNEKEKQRVEAERRTRYCETCKGEGKVIRSNGGESPNVWYDPCPTCTPKAATL